MEDLRREAREWLGLEGCSSPSVQRPVFARNTSSSVGACRWSAATVTSAESSARTTAASHLAVQANGHAGRGRLQLAEASEDLLELRRLRLLGRDCLDGRPPDLRLQCRRGPSATIRRSMIPTRSASKASSRYCVVGKTVTPSSRFSRTTSSQSALRLCGSSPVVGSSRKRMRGRCANASGSSVASCRPVAADLPVSSEAQADALEERVGAAVPPGAGCHGARAGA